jgi:LuxR family maltose regulon positive regulatory protein
LPPPLREFLLRTAVLPELTAARCAALTGDPLAARRLEDIDRAGLFVSVVGERELTLRLHDLFRECLETRFARDRPADFNAALRLAAATEAEPQRRVAWLQRAQAWAEAEQALIDAADELIAAGQATLVRSLFERFPADWCEASAGLQLLQARVRWDWDSVIDATAQAARACDDAGDAAARQQALSFHCAALAGANRSAQALAAAQALLAEPQLADDVRARTLRAAAWVELANGDPQRLAPLWDQLLQILERSPLLVRWTENVPLPAYIGMPGMRARLLRYTVGAQYRLPEQPTPLRGQCLVLEGWLALWAGDVDGALERAAAAADENRWLARPPSLDAPSRSLNALLLALTGDGAAAQAMLAALIAEIEGSGVALRIEVYLGLYQFLAMRCAALVDDQAALRQAATRLTLAPRGGRSWLSEARRAAAAAHLAALDGRLDEACQRWQALLDAGPRADLYGQAVDARLRLADGLCRRGAPPAEAAAVLAPLFADLEDGGDLGPVLLAGPALLRRLAAQDWQGGLTASRLARLQAWAMQSAALAAGRPTAAALPAGDAGPALAGPLTVRELEVLDQMAAGQSNKHIARALELSPHTVKRHVSNILDKLGLNSRGQAAHWYRRQRSGTGG